MGGNQWIETHAANSRQAVQLAAGWWWRRVHLRLWRWTSLDSPVATVGGAHLEHLLTLGVVGNPLQVAADFALLAAAVNLARLAVLGLSGNGGTWAAAKAD